MFANMMNKYLLFHFYSFDMGKVNIFFHCYMRLLKDNAPRLADMMEEYDIQCSVFLFEWVVALYTNIVSLSLSSRIWDSFLAYGDFYLMKISIALSVCIEK
jgi:hypothetical protein